MKQCRLSFDGVPQTWATALERAQEYLPSKGVTHEHRHCAYMEKQLLAVLLLAAWRAGQENFSYVQEMAKKLDDDPEAFAETLRHPASPEANLALELVLKSIGSLYCEPTKQLLLSLKNGQFK